jgi:hypothetical protein
MFLALDANFRLKRKDVSSEQKDPGLGNGWVFYCDVVAYMEHVKRNWNQKQEVRVSVASRDLLVNISYRGVIVWRMTR